ncbi:MAG TPA: hypothetical protein VNJ11_02130 [Bryobacteraceae bacterium]|nr:hypothetical protein [Bryobacteraceae bacterium]
MSPGLGVRAARMAFLLAVAIGWCARPGAAATFGKVVPIGGHIADLAYDARRNLVYIANFGASRVDVLAGSTQSLQGPIYVPAAPGTLALSPDGRFLVVGHFLEGTPPQIAPDPVALTVLDLDADQRRTLPQSLLGSSPLAVAFGAGSRALVVTRTRFFLLDPFTGELEPLTIVTDLQTDELPVPFATFPPEILRASAGVSGDGRIIWVAAQLREGAPEQVALIRYAVESRELRLAGFTASPPAGPRVVSVNGDGSQLLAGWALINENLILLAEFPYPAGELHVGGHAYDYRRDVIYAHIPLPAAEPGGASREPVLELFDTDNLTVRERLRLPENLAGKAVFSSDMEFLYAASDSGVTILPVGALARAPRVRAVQEDVLFPGNACDNRPIVREIDLVDLGGGATDFRLELPAGTRGIRLSGSAGSTPARVAIEVDPSFYRAQKGTTAIELVIRSSAAVNIPPPVRLLINTREPEQRGVLRNVPGKLVDVLADPVRNRLYVLRQDKNLVLVFDAGTYEQIAALRTGNTPVQMAMTRDNRYLIVTNDHSQLARVYDLETLEPSQPIVFPPGHYPRSIAVSNRSILAVARSASGPHRIDLVHFDERIATAPSQLGIYTNEVSAQTVLSASPSGNVIFGAMPDGTVLLYETTADTIVASRQDLEGLAGAYAALADGAFVVGPNLLNASLVPVAQAGQLEGTAAGYGLADGWTVRTLAGAPSSPGVIERVELSELRSVSGAKMIEAPVLAKFLESPPVGQTGQTILPFLRTLAPLANRQAMISLSRSGITILPWAFDEALAQPVVERVVNSADYTGGLAPGSLILIQGMHLSTVPEMARERPLPTILGEACITVNDQLVPLFRITESEALAQLPYTVSGTGRLIVRSPGGTSNPFVLTILPGAPAVFRSGAAGPQTGLPTIVRQKNGELVTLSNPIHPEEAITIYLTGLGVTSPLIEAGQPAPGEPVAQPVLEPRLTLGQVGLPIQFVGLVAGEIGVYRIDATIPFWVPTGMSVPLTIAQGTYSTTLSVRVVR